MPKLNDLVNARTVRRRSANAASFMGVMAALGAEGLTSFGPEGIPTQRKRRRARPNLNHESMVYRSRGHGNQHTPPNYPKTRRKRKTRRERGEDRFAAKCSADGWNGYFKREIAAR